MSAVAGVLPAGLEPWSSRSGDSSRGDRRWAVNTSFSPPRFGEGSGEGFSRATVLDFSLPLAIGLLSFGLLYLADYLKLGQGPLRTGLAFGLPCILVFTFVDRPRRFGFGVAALLLAGAFSPGEGRLFLERNFFGVVRVSDAKGAPPTIPFWLGEAPARSDELSRAVSDLRADVDVRLGCREPELVRRLLLEVLSFVHDEVLVLRQDAAARHKVRQQQRMVHDEPRDLAPQLSPFLVRRPIVNP